MINNLSLLEKTLYHTYDITICYFSHIISHSILVSISILPLYQETQQQQKAKLDLLIVL